VDCMRVSLEGVCRGVVWCGVVWCGVDGVGVNVEVWMWDCECVHTEAISPTFNVLICVRHAFCRSCITEYIQGAVKQVRTGLVDSHFCVHTLLDSVLIHTFVSTLFWTH
jgi:hypothetical protein